MDADGRLRSVEDIEAPSDEVAVLAVDRLLAAKEHVIAELWVGGVLIYRNERR
jgi:hypothetical protein